MQNLNDMMTFASVADAGGFTEAARRLGTSKSSVSKSVAKLERSLGVRLLNRSTRGLSMTEIGFAYYDHCVRIADEVAQAAELVSELQSEPRGVLKVTCPVAFGRLHVAPAVAAYLSQHPRMQIHLTTTDRVVDLVSEGLDVAIRIAQEPSPQHVARELAPATRVICATQGYLDRYGVPKTAQELAHHNCLHYTHFGSHGEWRLQGAEGQIMVRVSGSLRVNDDDVLSRAVNDGLGLALLPTFIVGDDLRTGRLHSVLSDFVPIERRIYAVHLPNVRMPRKVHGFIDFLQARIGPVPYWDLKSEPDASPAVSLS